MTDNSASGYDGGDCCQCTCVSTEDYTCGDDHHGGYACLDPSAPCVDDDDITTLPEFNYGTYSRSSTKACYTFAMSDGDCDPTNNNEECGASILSIYTAYVVQCTWRLLLFSLLLMQNTVSIWRLNAPFPAASRFMKRGAMMRTFSHVLCFLTTSPQSRSGTIGKHVFSKPYMIDGTPVSRRVTRGLIFYS